MATKKKATKAKKSSAKVTHVTSPEGYRVGKIYKSSKTIGIDTLPTDYERADLEFIGVEHGGASYEARVYVNNPNADASTQPTETNGYAGSFYVFGHGGCFGDAGHCDIHAHHHEEFDPRRSHPLEPMKKLVVATDAIRAAAVRGKPISVTVVPIVTGWTDLVEDTYNVLKFDHINLATYY